MVALLAMMAGFSCSYVSLVSLSYFEEESKSWIVFHAISFFVGVAVFIQGSREILGQ